MKPTPTTMKANPTNHTGQVPSRPILCLTDTSRFPGLIRAAAACFVLLALALNSIAANFAMNASDASGSDSFDNAGHWTSGAAPSPGNNYFSMGFTIRTAADSVSRTFQGDSLTISNSATAAFPYVGLGLKNNTLTTVTITNLIMQTNSGIGNISNSGGAVNRVAGNMSVLGPMVLTDVNSSPRTIAIDSTMSGSGTITNAVIAIYSANNSSFTGQLVAVFSTGWGNERGTIIVTNQAAMGGNPATFNAAQLELNNGIFSPKGSFALDHSNAGITIDAGGGIFDIASGLILTNAEPLAGPGTLSLTNSGTFVHLGTAASFTGTLAVNNGTFILGAGGSLAGSNTISPGSAATFDASATGLSLASGQTLAGNGTVIGSVTAGTGGKLSPGGAANAVTLTLTGDLTLSGGATLLVDFLATNDTVAVGGNFSPSGVTSIQLGGAPAVGTYPLFTVAGTLGGSPANFTVSALSTRSKSYAVVYDTVSTPKRVLLQVTSSGSAADLIWQGDVVSGLNNVWDISTTSNWLYGASSDVYYDADAVNFTDVGATNQPTLNVTVNPSAVTFNSSSNYTLTGSGAIAGVTSLTKGGTGTFTISTTNTYSGGTIITNGVLQIGTNALRALGSPSGATALATISGTGTLDLNGTLLDSAYTNAIQINGNGSSATQGAIDTTISGLTSGTPGPGVATVALLGNSTVSASGNWQIGNTGQGIVGNGFTLTKTGNGYLYLRRAAASPLGNLVISGPGGVLFWDRADAAGVTTPITLTNGGYFDTWITGGGPQGLTFYNPVIVNDPVNGGWINNYRPPNYGNPAYDIFNGNFVLNGTLTISNVSYLSSSTPPTFGRETFNGNISGTGGVYAIGRAIPFLGGPTVFYGGNKVIFNGNNSYSGLTVASNLVVLQTTTANQSGGAYDIEENGTLDVALAPGKPTLPMSSLVLGPYVNVGPANLGFARLTSLSSSPVIYATNLTINGSSGSGNQNGILPPTAGYSVGQFPLVKYGTIGGNGFSALVLNDPPRGVTASLVDNAGNNSIDLLVTTTGIAWRGNNSSAWDIGTANWYNPVSSSSDSYQDGDSVVFDDTATNRNVELTQVVQPTGVTVNSTNDYLFTNVVFGTSSINGAGALIKNGSGTLTMACTNNNYTGGTFINGGTIKLVDTDFGYPHGGGGLNNNLGTVVVANGGTLDVNGVMVPNYQQFGPAGYDVYISGSGVNGQGALVNNNTNAPNNDNADPGYVTLVGDATIGGPSDLNIRHGGTPQLTSQSGDYTLTKIGAGRLRIRYVTTVSPNFGPVNILGGVVSYESSSTLGFGDPTKPIYVGSGAGFAWGTTAANCVRPLICSNGASIYGYNITNNLIGSPVTLVSGNVDLNANFYNGMIFTNILSGAGGVTVQYQSYVTFQASNTYSGNTIVANCNSGPGSVLRLVGNGSINNSPNISLQGITASQAFAGALDASGRTDGTLTLVNNQTLRGDNGSYVRGTVVATSGTTITPGGLTNIQYMSISNNLTLQSGSTVRMDVSLVGGATNDLIRVVGAMNYGSATLQITNIGATALTNGASFKLFNNGSFSGNFATVSDASGVTWSFNPTNGVATVVSVPVASKPIITSIGLSGTTLTLTATNGIPNGQYILLGSSNVASPLLQWTPVLTNAYDSNGSINLSTNVVNPGIPLQFYILLQ
jgi:fibronectin-binding autotransporter adhesin